MVSAAPFAAALLLDDLDQDDLIALDNFLNFVVSPAPLVTLGQFFQCVFRADNLNRSGARRLGNGDDAAFVA